MKTYRYARVGLLSFCVAVSSMANGQDAHAPHFEVASVKPSDPNSTQGIGLFTFPGGKIICHWCPLSYLIENAFGVSRTQIRGGPGWIDGDKFDLTAIPPEDSPVRSLNPASPKLPPNQEQRDMLKTLLAERFGLKVRHDSIQGKVLWLVSTGKTPKLKEAEDHAAMPYANVTRYPNGTGNGEIVGKNVPMPFFAQRLSDVLGHTVLDKTGLAGAYGFHVDAPEAAHADITDAVLEGVKQLGLKLQAAKDQESVIVVEAAERPSAD